MNLTDDEIRHLISGRQPHKNLSVCERPIKMNARGLLHRHKAGTSDLDTCPGSGQPPVDAATIIAAANDPIK